MEKIRNDFATLKNKLLGKIKSPIKKEETSIAIQLLIFHYLGFLGQIEVKDNKLKATLLAEIFNRKGQENIRKALSNVGDKKSKSNLEYLESLFEKLDLQEPLKKVRKDLRRNQSQ
jgi:hypothetical protein